MNLPTNLLSLLLPNDDVSVSVEEINGYDYIYRSAPRRAAPRRISLQPSTNSKLKKRVKSRESSSMAYAVRHQLPNSCTLHFDGACFENPGKAGAGVIIRSQDGKMIYRLREGVGYATNDVAEYRALIFGLIHAYRKGYRHVHVHGDSELVCNQVQGLWGVNSLVQLHSEVMHLKKMFESFDITYIPKENNTEADFQANMAINLADGAMHEESEEVSQYLDEREEL